MAPKFDSKQEMYEAYNQMFAETRKSIRNKSYDGFDFPDNVDDPYDPIAVRYKKWESNLDDKSYISEYHYMVESDQIQRRIRAAIKNEQKAIEKIGWKGGQKSFTDIWIFLSSLILKGGYDSVDRSGECILAAAVWILDEINQSDKMQELYPFLIDAYEDHDIASEFHFHPCYDSNLIAAVMNTIIHRNDEVCDHDKRKRYWTDAWTTSLQRKESASSKRRQNFEGMMALLKKEHVEQAKRNYENKVWGFYRIACLIDQALQKKMEKYNRDIDYFEKKISEHYSRLLSKPKESRRPVLTPLMHPPKNEVDTISILNDPEREKLEQEKDRLSMERRRLESVIMADFSSMAYENEREKWAMKWKDFAPNELLNELVCFSVNDPYESCFALLALLEDNSDIPWLYYGSVAVFYTMKDQLPTFRERYIKDIHREKYILNNKPDENYQMVYTSEKRFENEPDSEGDQIIRQRAENFAQKVFSRTFTMLPRIKTELPGMDVLMKELGVKTEGEKKAYELLLQVIWATTWDGMVTRDGLKQYIDVINAKEKEQEKSIEDPEPEDDSIDPGIISELKQKNDILNRYLRDEAAKVRTLQDERDELLRESDDMRRELAELRNIVFNREHPDLTETENNKGISFPYITKQRIVCFGGHQSWLKAMKDYLPEVRFISPEMLPNTTLLRIADSVWIQPNCLSHADYYRIMNVAREQHIKIHYFEYDSAQKCAVQLAENDQNSSR